MYDVYSIYLIAFSTIAVYGVFSLIARAVSIVRDWYIDDRITQKRKIWAAIIMAIITGSAWGALFTDDGLFNFVDDRHQVIETMVGVTVALLSYLIYTALAGVATRGLIKRPKNQARTQVWQDGEWKDHIPGMVC